MICEANFAMDLLSMTIVAYRDSSMSAEITRCPKCGGQMVQGFIVDWHEGGGSLVSQWVEGPPEKSFWHGTSAPKDKRCTGIAVGGFGAGALVTAPVATRLIQSGGVLQTFAYLGVAYLVITMATGYFMKNPPDGWKPAGWAPSATQTAQRAAIGT